MSERPGEKKMEGIPTSYLTNPIIAAHPTRFAGLISHDLLKTALPTGVKPLVSRPIAPAPGLAVAAAVNVSNRLIGTPGHTIIPKSVTLGGGLEGLSLQQGVVTGNPTNQTMAVNLSTQTANNPPVNQALHIAMPQQSLHNFTLPTTGLPQGLVHGQQIAQMSNPDDKDKSRIALMTQTGMSEIDKTRATIPMASLIRQALPHQGLQQSPAQVNLTLTSNPGGQGHLTQQAQTPIIHNLPPSHIPRGAAAASALAAPRACTLPNPIHRPITTHFQSPLLPTLTQSMRGQLRQSGPVTQSTNTTVAPAGPQHQSEVQRASAHIMTSLSAPSAVQISSLPGRPMLSQLQAAKAGLTQPPMIQAYTTQGQKVMVTQSQILAPGGNTGQPIVTTPKLTGQGIALNLNQSGIPRTQKMSTQIPQVSVQGQLPGVGQTTLSLSQSLHRGPKIVSQGNIPPGAVVVNAAAKPGVAGINLGQAMQRPQKVVMSHLSAAMPGTPSVSIATIPRPVLHGNTVTQAMTAATMVTTTTMTTVPLMKVAQHAGLAHTPTTPSTDHRDQPNQVQTRPQLSHVQPSQIPGHIQVPGHVQTSLYSLPGNRPQLTNQVAVTTTPVTTPVGMPGPERQVRPGFPFSLQDYNAISGAISGATNFYPYNLVYQTAAFTSANTIRPSLVPGQPGNLAATLQAMPQVAVTAATGMQPTAKINTPSVVVNVDPSRPNAITMATQYAGAKPAEPSQITPVISTPLVAGAVTTHPVGTPLTPSHGTASTNQQQGTPNQPTNASPRPSILRKRPHEPGVMIVKKNLLSSVNAVDGTDHIVPLSALSPKPLPLDPNRENSQSSTDTASSTESPPQSEIKVKTEPMDADNDNSSGMFGLNNNSVEASPRKKPRKQRLDANHEMRDDQRNESENGVRDELQEEEDSSDEELNKLAKEDIKQELEWLEERRQEEKKPSIPDDVQEVVDDDGVRWTREKHRPPVNLMNHYMCNWKSRNNHFMRYTEVKAKDERRPTVNELANQKGIHQKASGWKLYHLAAQLEELMDLERDVFSSMSLVQDCIAPKHIAKNPSMEDDISMVHELTQGNIQRCQLVMDQLEEARVSMVKVLDHKQRISEIINKHHSKRPVKKKERT